MGTSYFDFYIRHVFQTKSSLLVKIKQIEPLLLSPSIPDPFLSQPAPTWKSEWKSSSSSFPTRKGQFEPLGSQPGRSVSWGGGRLTRRWLQSILDCRPTTTTCPNCMCKIWGSTWNCTLEAETFTTSITIKSLFQHSIRSLGVIFGRTNKKPTWETEAFTTCIHICLSWLSELWNSEEDPAPCQICGKVTYITIFCAHLQMQNDYAPTLPTPQHLWTTPC